MKKSKKAIIVSLIVIVSLPLLSIVLILALPYEAFTESSGILRMVTQAVMFISMLAHYFLMGITLLVCIVGGIFLIIDRFAPGVFGENATVILFSAIFSAAILFGIASVSAMLIEPFGYINPFTGEIFKGVLNSGS